MATFSVLVDLAALTMLGANEVAGDVTFTPVIAGGSSATWTTDGERLAFPVAETKTVTAAGTSQTFVLAHPEGWLIPFSWQVVIKADGGRTVLTKTLATPIPGSVQWLPKLLEIPVVTPPGTVMQTLRVPASITDGSVLVKSGETVSGISADQFIGQEATFTQSGTLRGVFVSPGDTIPVGTPPWTLVVEVG